MTQDQYGQAGGSGSVVHGDVVSGDETEEGPDEQAKPMTRFQKVASAFRGDKPDQDEPDRDEPEQAEPERAASTVEAPSAADQDVPPAGSPLPASEASPGARQTGGPGTGRRDYWDVDPEAEEDQVTAVTSPDAPDAPDADRLPGEGADHRAMQPDMFGTARPGNGSTPVTSQADTPTIPDVPPGDTAAGRHAATGAPEAAAAANDLRPGEAAGKLGDFSDLTYGDLIPDAGKYTAQWQHIQFRFVDDPHGSVTEAAEVISQVTAQMEAAIQERQRAIEERQRAIAEQQRSLRGRWGEGTNADTEALRETLRMYRTFLNQLIGPKAG